MPEVAAQTPRNEVPRGAATSATSQVGHRPTSSEYVRPVQGTETVTARRQLSPPTGDDSGYRPDRLGVRGTPGGRRPGDPLNLFEELDYWRSDPADIAAATDDHDAGRQLLDRIARAQPAWRNAAACIRGVGGHPRRHQPPTTKLAPSLPNPSGGVMMDYRTEAA